MDQPDTAFPPFAVTVDLVVFTLRDGVLHALVIDRGVEPFAGDAALPGGFVRPDEDLLGAARRELAEETGLLLAGGHLEQLGSYGAPDRDPRMRVVSVAHLALLPDLPTPVAGTDAAGARWVPVEALLRGEPALAFDHGAILRDGLERARAKLEYSTLATAFCAEPFTIADLRRVYEAVWGAGVDPRNFHRKVTGAPGFIEPTGATTVRDGGRPAQLYRRGPATALTPPLTRPEPAS
ncbi:NUDIX hydrolase [Propioniciclava coleopterorum]|uniref:NUDIX hydrolase n=1 Tax=Propioniciclava coleopterorum TaxID=2714937 RepID=A0A6G7Y8H0_9ACTN|nr:NUDIX domain-containing protein [Propioniciclava coleopterorum]QIK72948.1 NUDIX hydrolase [Propioniciclava coleopterorum]